MNNQNNISRWRNYNDLIYCQACNYMSPKVMVYDATWGKWKEERLLSNYCPNCGRYMKKESIEIYD